MRFLIDVTFPHEPFNTLVRDGTAVQKLNRILEEVKPEAVYFHAREGKRGCTLICNIDNPSRLPAIAEPFFLLLHAECEPQLVMTPEDLKQAKLEDLGKRWGSIK